MNHCQHVLIGKFRQDLPGKQVFYISREKKQPEAKYAFALATMFTKSGERLWSRIGQDMWYMGGAKVDNWTGQLGRELIALYSRGFFPPALIDGYGREVASFPFPPGIEEKGVYGDYYVQHLDCYGDEREEILVFNHKALYIYTNAALWQKPRLYNNNYYPGRL